MYWLQCIWLIALNLNPAYLLKSTGTKLLCLKQKVVKSLDYCVWEPVSLPPPRWSSDFLEPMTHNSFSFLSHGHHFERKRNGLGRVSSNSTWWCSPIRIAYFYGCQLSGWKLWEFRFAVQFFENFTFKQLLDREKTRNKSYIRRLQS